MKFQGHDFTGGLQKRGLMEDPLVWCYIEQIMHSFPLAAILNDSYLCISGGIGTELMKYGIPGLRAVQRPATLMSHISITMECQWACLKLSGDSEVQTDGSPMFTEEMVTKFCAENKLRMIIRSRQLVAEGILNFPEQMITLWTPVSFLDSFRNASVSLRLNGENHKASIMKYQTHDREAGSLDDDKPPAGRNAMIL
uniref:protein-serine/threonine phosphatase n=1 Tax=Panagrolaimus davidi TaxID=227884 RepID=A0A914PP33_9BILA